MSKRVELVVRHVHVDEPSVGVDSLSSRFLGSVIPGAREVRFDVNVDHGTDCTADDLFAHNGKRFVPQASRADLLAALHRDDLHPTKAGLDALCELLGIRP